MTLKMNQDTYGDFLGYKESHEMTSDTTRLHKTSFQEVDSLKISKILSKSWRMAGICGMIQNLGWTQLEYTLKIIRVAVENSSFGCNLIFEIWSSEGLSLLA